jgi:monothiol glutaredoxin
MSRKILDESRIHPDIREHMATNHADIVREVEAAVSASPVVIVGMRLNPVVRSARKALDNANIAYKYLEYGGYFSDWRRRNALKMWTGWPTFPMIFVRGVLVGGGSDLAKLLESGALGRIIAG